MIKKVMPAIKEKVGTGPITIQQDGAMPHTAGGLMQRIARTVEHKYGMELTIETQPAQSPDLNLSDISNFASLQAQQRNRWTTDVDGLIKAVDAIWAAYPWETIERAWLTLFGVYNLILEHDGDNDFKLPHTGAREQQQEGRVPANAPLSASALQHARAISRWLKAHDNFSFNLKLNFNGHVIYPKSGVLNIFC